MHCRRRFQFSGAVLVLVCFLGALSLTGAVAPAEAVEEDLNATASVDDDSVWIGDDVDVTVTVGNTVNESYRIDSVTLVDDSDEVRAERDVFEGPIETGEEQTLEFDDLSVEDPGVTEFRILTTVEDRLNRVDETLETSVEVQASNPEPVVDLTADQAPDTGDPTLSLALGNPHDEPLNRMEATLDSPEDATFDFLESSATVTTIEPGETHELEFTVGDAPTGTYEFPLSLSFETADGEQWERTTSVSASVNEADDSIQVDVAEVSVSATPNGVQINGSLFTTGNTTVQDVQITPAETEGVGPARPSPQAYISDLSGQGSDAFELTASLAEDRDSVPLTVQYRYSGTDWTTTIEIPYAGPRNVDPVQLTDVTTTGDTDVSINGEVANTRGTEVTGVTISIPETENVSPGTPGEFFAGSIDAGTFTPLEPIRAEITGDVETIPVEISYGFEGIQYTSVVEVEHGSGQSAVGNGGQQQEDDSAPAFDPGTDESDDDDDNSLFGSLFPVIGGLVALAGLVVAAVVYKRR